MKKDIVVVLAIFIIATGVYQLSAIITRHITSPDSAYFDQLADSFLHGQVFLAAPKTNYDLTLFNGKWYLPFLPLPALLLLPWVAMAGLENINTVFFGCVIGGVNVSLVFLLLQSLSQRGWSKASTNSNLGLTLLFSLGTVHWYMTIQGSVWFLAQICTITFMLLSLLLATKFDSPVTSGLALGIAMLGRPTVVLMYPILLAIHLQSGKEQTGNSLKIIVRWSVLSFLPIVACSALILWYNQLRFQNPLYFGYLTENISSGLKQDLAAYGQFNFHYFLHNVWSMLLAGPTWDATRGMILPSFDGMSVFLTTPALLLLGRSWKKTPLSMGAWLSVILLLIPLLLYYNTGWWQFGYRFSLDVIPVIMILFALAVNERLDWIFWTLIGIGILINAWGAWWFLNPLYL